MRLAPSKICYSQDSINNRFDCRSRHGDKYIGETLDDICEGRCTVEDIPRVSVMKNDGKWVTADNRRLWVFRELERLDKCETVPVSITYSIPVQKMTSYNGGISVSVRRNPGGRWYKKSAPSTSRPMYVSSVAASRSISRSPESSNDQGLTNSFRNAAPAYNRGSFISYIRPSTSAVNSTSPRSLTTALRSMSVTHTTPRTASTEPLELAKSEEAKSKSKPYLVCAMDFGTTFSGWAYSFKDDYEKDPKHGYIKQWHCGSGSLCTEKTPTVALISPDGRTLVAFGYEAENEYKRLMENNQHNHYYLFRRFKMTLYKRLGEGITRNIVLEDELGRHLPAMDVFSMCIKYLADDLKENIRQKTDGLVGDRRIDWVLTVPAIWTDAAKQFMRGAATKAGLSSDRLTLVLEPEAASLLCRHLTSDDVVGDVEVHRPTTGSKYMIFDAGGGTVDITLHQVGTSGTLREVKPACGADCGGTMVDKAFGKLMMDLVGEDVYEEFRTTEQGEFMDFQREFELKKHGAGRSPSGKITIRIPSALMEIYLDATGEQLKDAIATSEYSDDVSLVRDSLRFDAIFFESLFEKSITRALFEVKKILQNEDLSVIHSIYMVGGYSQSPVLQKRMKEAYPTLNVVIPHDASTCVLKGALIYGHNPTTISERVLKYTYGFAAADPFDPNVHPISKQIMTDKGLYCNSVFTTFVKKGETVHIGTMQTREILTTCMKHKPSLKITLYASDKESPRFVDESGCRKIGETRLVFEAPLAMEYPTATVYLTFSGTEIVVEAVEVATGKKITSNMNFLG